MSETGCLSRAQRIALEHIERCPSCGAWVHWPTVAALIAAELEPHACQHTNHAHMETAA